jgi:hypothetical protein
MSPVYATLGKEPMQMNMLTCILILCLPVVVNYAFSTLVLYIITILYQELNMCAAVGSLDISGMNLEVN